MAKKEAEKKEAKKRGRPKKTATVKKSAISTQKIENRYVVNTDANQSPKNDYYRDMYDMANKWANTHPSPKSKPLPVWKNLPDQNSKEWDNLPYQVRQLNYKPTENDICDMPNYFSVMELAKKHPEQRAFFFALANYVESTGHRMTVMAGVLSKARRGEKLTFEDGLKLQWANDMMLDDFIALRKAIKKAKE